jgi:hypothetical protein
MNINALPAYNPGDNPTNCCPRFHPEGWDRQDLHFRDKLFVKARTRSIFHIPINMGAVYSRTQAAIDKAGAMDKQQFIVLSRDISPWTAEHYFAVKREVPGVEMARLSGDYMTRVFEGPYRDAPRWMMETRKYVEGLGKKFKQTYFFYTTCPRCSRAYGKNYVVGVAEVE